MLALYAPVSAATGEDEAYSPGTIVAFQGDEKPEEVYDMSNYDVSMITFSLVVVLPFLVAMILLGVDFSQKVRRIRTPYDQGRGVIGIPRLVHFPPRSIFAPRYARRIGRRPTMFL